MISVCLRGQPNWSLGHKPTLCTHAFCENRLPSRAWPAPTRLLVARALTYEIAAGLTKINGVAVFGLLVRDRTEDVALPAPDADYALLGSVRSNGSMLRVTTILSDFRTGELLRSWNFEKELGAGDTSDIQSEIASRIVSAFAELCASKSGSGEVGPRKLARRTTSYSCRDITRIAAR